jgi:hypothetical protein
VFTQAGNHPRFVGTGLEDHVEGAGMLAGLFRIGVHASAGAGHASVRHFGMTARATTSRRAMARSVCSSGVPGGKLDLDLEFALGQARHQFHAQPGQEQGQAMAKEPYGHGQGRTAPDQGFPQNCRVSIGHELDRRG